MDIAALVVSIFALLAAGGAAFYTRSYALTAKRAVELESEPQIVLEKSTAPRISGSPVVPRISVRNVGRTIALSVTVSVPGGKEHAAGALKPDQATQIKVRPDEAESYEVRYLTSDQRKRVRSMGVL